MRRVVLCILDGWGVRPGTVHNGIAAASHWHELTSRFPYTQIQASEHYVGLPDGQMGNSEVGHMTIGLGRVCEQDLPRLNRFAQEGNWGALPRVQRLVETLQQTGKACHLMGLFSAGGIHSHKNHLMRVAAYLKAQGIPTYLHLFLDGRDTPPQSALTELADINQIIGGGVTLATLAGRYYAMDRDNRWERTHKAYDAIVLGHAENSFTDASDYINRMYSQHITDEFMLPAIHEGYTGVESGDAVWHINFRSDRVRQLYTALVAPAFNHFDRPPLQFSHALGMAPAFNHFDRPPLQFSHALGMAPYGEALEPYVETIFEKPQLRDSLGEVMAQRGLKQLRVAETEKYAHVTFFLNGGREEPFPGEERCLVPSPKVATYDLQPEMSAAVIKNNVIQAVQSGQYALIVVNFANTDMVGHTGVPAAIQKAVACVDGCVKAIADTCLATQTTLVITADHGNAEEMRDNQGNPHTAHTCNPVPFVVVGGAPSLTLKKEGGTLADVAPTVLDLMGIAKPLAMTGQSLCVGL
jgi:2,3-bisphosphoglycerate-independent phosphoglycerate mutase